MLWTPHYLNTHNICFHGEIKKITTFRLKKTCFIQSYEQDKTISGYTFYFDISILKYGKYGEKEGISLRKHDYSNMLKISPPKTKSFQIKILIFFIFLLKT